MRDQHARRGKVLAAIGSVALLASLSGPASAHDRPKLTPEQKLYAHAEDVCTDDPATFRTFEGQALFACYRSEKHTLDKSEVRDLLYDCYKAAEFRGSQIGSFGVLKNAKGSVNGLECVVQF